MKNLKKEVKYGLGILALLVVLLSGVIYAASGNFFRINNTGEANIERFVEIETEDAEFQSGGEKAGFDFTGNYAEGKTVSIDSIKNSTGCIRVLNNDSSQDFFLPFKTAAEWEAFKQNHPENITITKCLYWGNITSSQTACNGVGGLNPGSSGGPTYTPDTEACFNEFLTQEIVGGSNPNTIIASAGQACTYNQCAAASQAQCGTIPGCSWDTDSFSCFGFVTGSNGFRENISKQRCEHKSCAATFINTNAQSISTDTPPSLFQGCNGIWSTPFLADAQTALTNYNVSSNSNVSAADIAAAQSAINSVNWGNDEGNNNIADFINGTSGGVGWSIGRAYTSGDVACSASISVRIQESC